MTGLADYKNALAMRDTIQALVRTEMERIRPQYQYATVVTIDYQSRRCFVQFRGEATPVPVGMGIEIQPTQAGQIVRIDGVKGDRFIADVITPGEDAVSEDWRTATPSGSWANSASFYPFQYYKDLDGWVHLRGWATHTSPVGTTMFTLPSTHRPPIPCSFTVMGDDVLAVITINTNGNVVFTQGAATFYVALSGIRFFAGTVNDIQARATGRFKLNQNYATALDVNAGKIPYVFERADGLCRYMGQIQTPASITEWTIGNAPDFTSGKFRSLHLAPDYTGSTWQAGRIDLDASICGLYVPFRSNSSGNYFEVNGAVWNGRSEAGGWVTLTLENSWVPYGNNYPPLQARLDGDQVVHIRGVIKNGTTTSPTTIATLPVGMRPSSWELFGVYNNGAAKRVDVLPTGVIQLASSGWSNVYAGMDNIFFRLT